MRPHLGQRGVIIVAAHAGPYTMLGLMGRRWLAEQGFSGELAIVARMFRPFRSGALMDWFMDYFTRAGITRHLRPRAAADDGQAADTNVLENNGIVVLLVDEPTPTPSAVVPFFDSAIKMPLGPVRLARATDSVIVPTIASYEPRPQDEDHAGRAAVAGGIGQRGDAPPGRRPGRRSSARISTSGRC